MNEARVGAVILAAGHSRRMGATNKLLLEVGGRPMVRIAAEAALASQANAVVVVTGHEAAKVEEALVTLDVGIAFNPEHEEGMASSIRQGIAALGDTCDGAIIMLADMPEIDTDILNRLVEAFRTDPTRIVVPTNDGRRGNPVVWPQRLCSELAQLRGDIGGRRLIEQHAELVTEVPLGPAVRHDIDSLDDQPGAGR